MWFLSKYVILRLDPRSEFMLPVESTCTLRDPVPSRATCAPLRRHGGPVAQLSMRRGKNISTVRWTGQSFRAHLATIVKFFDGCARLTEFGFVHGDIKPDNILYFEEDSTLRLIDYDFLSNFNMTDLAGMRSQVTAIFDRGEIFTRDSAVAYLNTGSSALDVLLMAERPSRFAIDVAPYFPPENHIGSSCVDIVQKAAVVSVPIRRADIIRHFRTHTMHLRSLLNSWLPREFFLRLTVASAAYEADYVAFLDSVLRDDASRTFTSSFYPDKHDAFQLGVVLAYIVGMIFKNRNISASNFQSGICVVLLTSLNALLCADPSKRAPTRLVHSQLLAFADALDKLAKP